MDAAPPLKHAKKEKTKQNGKAAQQHQKGKEPQPGRKRKGEKDGHAPPTSKSKRRIQPTHSSGGHLVASVETCYGVASGLRHMSCCW